MKEFNIVVTGVGGQGVLTMSMIIAQAAMKQGLDVRTTELHGLAQRGGSIPVHIRFGEKMYSGIVMEGEANLVISLEPLEALRTAYFGSKKHSTTFVVDNYKIPPITVSALGEVYPSMESIISRVKPFAEKIIVLNASDIVKKETGSIITSNIFILGYIVGKGILPLKENFVMESIKENVPEKYFDLNRKVFEMGMQYK
jgi:indolepyruvate ferredoxin oxidoreductase, beta subunit